MRATVIYESVFGNTRDVATAVALGLRASMDADLVEVGELTDLPVSDLWVVGGPTHAWGMTRATTRRGARDQAAARHVEPVSRGRGIREWIAELPPGDRAVAVFDTAADTTWFPTGSAARAAAKRLQAMGYHLIAPPEQFRVHDTAGPLLAGELDRARAWGGALAWSVTARAA